MWSPPKYFKQKPNVKYTYVEKPTPQLILECDEEVEMERDFYKIVHDIESLNEQGLYDDILRKINGNRLYYRNFCSAMAEIHMERRNRQLIDRTYNLKILKNNLIKEISIIFLDKFKNLRSCKTYILFEKRF